MAELFLNEQHQGIVRSYIQFARYLRMQNLKAIEMCVQDILDSRLVEATYTRTEVEDILQDLRRLVLSDAEAELISLAHTSALLLSQVLTQAERWHLRITVDLSEIQNKELLENMKTLEGTELSNKSKLEPLPSDSGSLELLRIEIDRLQSENQRLEIDFTHLENQVIKFKEERNKMIGKVEMGDEIIKELKEEIEKMRNRCADNIQKDITEKQNEKPDAENLLSQYEQVLSEQLGSEMESVRNQITTVQSQLTLAEQELERKFNQTAAYTNMKKIIAKKNEQVKELRKKLLKYEPHEEGGESD